MAVNHLIEREMKKLLALSLLAVLAATGCDERRNRNCAPYTTTSASPINRYVNTAAGTIIYTTAPAKTRRNYRRERWESEKAGRYTASVAKKKVPTSKSYTVRKSYTAKSSRSVSRSARK